MAIQNRRGVYSDFTPSKMVPGELAVVQSGDPNNTSGKAVYAAFGASGDVKRLASEDDLSGKVDKVTGKGLSTNDYTTAEKNKLSGIEAQANKTVIDSTLTQTGQAADAKAVGDAIDSVTIETDKTLTEEDVPADAKVVGDELSSIKSDLNEKASAIISSASGSIAHFEDGSESDAVDVVAHINPVQSGSGDPAPDNVRPITGFTGMNVVRTGRNLLSEIELGSITRINATTDGGTITLNGTVSGSGYLFIALSDYFFVKAGTYTLYANNPDTIPKLNSNSYAQLRIRVLELSESRPDDYRIGLENSYGKVVVTFPQDYHVYLELRLYSGQELNNFKLSPMLVLGSNMDEEFTSPIKTTYPITFPSEAGTVYGGYVDTTNGKLVVDRASNTINSNNTIETIGTSGHGWYVARNSMTKPPLVTGENYSDGVICDRLKTLIASSSVADNVIFVNNNGQIRINTEEVFASKSDMLAGLGGSITVAYPIEPVTYDLTPTQIATLLGVNNIWHDCNGDTDVEYNADTKLYIEQLTKPTEDDMTANGNIASGKFFMIGNRLFLSTAVIASGDKINPGTNCTELSLADALNNLNS